MTALRPVPGGRRRRGGRAAGVVPGLNLAALCLALTLAALCLTACGPAHPGPRPSPPSFGNTEAAVVSCLLARHLIPRRQVRGQPWLVGGHVYGDAALTSWLFNHAGTVYGGKTLDAWATSAARHWPTSFCGRKPAIPPSP